MGVIVLLVILAGIVLMNLFATIQVCRDEFGEPRQRVFQALFVWLVPIIGALLVIGIHRQAEKPSRAYRATEYGVEDGSGVAPGPYSLGKSISELLEGD